MPGVKTRLYRHTDKGAPALNAGTSGSIFAVLDAVLCDGYNVQPCLSISPGAGVWTVGMGEGHGFVWPDVVEIRGAVPASADGFYRVKSVTNNSVSLESSVAAPSLTGASMRKASLGWSKLGSASDSRAYSSAELNSSRSVYIFKHTGGSTVSIEMHDQFISFTDTATRRFADSWGTLITTSAGKGSEWCVVGDGRTFYILIGGTTDSAVKLSNFVSGFGDIDSFLPITRLGNVGFACFKQPSYITYSVISGQRARAQRIPGQLSSQDLYFCSTGSGHNNNQKLSSWPTGRLPLLPFLLSIGYSAGLVLGRHRLASFVSGIYDKTPIAERKSVELLSDGTVLMVGVGTNSSSVADSSDDHGCIAFNVVDDWVDYDA